MHPKYVAALAIVGGLSVGAGRIRNQEVETGRKKAEVCAACHGLDGNQAQPPLPILAGQTARYLYLQIRDFQQGRRTDPQMAPFVKNLSQEDMLDLASFFAAQKARPAAFTPDEAKVERGKQRASETLCTMCHLGGFMGQNEIPRVAGQRYEYIVKQMQDFKYGRRTNDAGTMTSVSKTLSDADIDDLAHYLAGLY
jgi:cytochrome c553